jgi:hypothetical protein
MDNFFQFLWALVTFQWVRDVHETASAVGPSPSISLMRPSRYCGDCGELVFLTNDMTWLHLTTTKHQAAPLLISDGGEPDDPDLNDDDFWESE